MIKRILKFLIVRPVQFLISLPRIRYSLIGGIYNNAYDPREKMLNFAMRYVRVSGLKGDYFEFGVYRGDTMIAAYHIAQRDHLGGMQFYAFDSFEGLPEPDRNGAQQFKKGQFACSKEQFKKNLLKHGVDLFRVHIVPGWYKDTLNAETRKKLPAQKAAIVYIDCDLYESAADVLNFITPYLEHGTLILFDEWFAYRGDPGKGEQKAFREWLAKHPEISAVEYHKFAWSGNSFIIHVKDKQ